MTSPTIQAPHPPVTPPAGNSGLRVALVHDWLLGMRGGERLLESLLTLFPNAPIHTLFYRPEKVTRLINERAIAPSALNALPGGRRYYRWLLPLMPGAVERMRFAPGTELVLALSHCVAHGAPAPAGALRINYYLSPMRYLYDQGPAYRRGLSGRGLKWFRPRLERWDREAAGRAAHHWAISKFVAERVRRAYGLEARVIYPPVRTDFFRPSGRGKTESAERLEKPEKSDRSERPERSEEFLLVSAMVPYKRVELAIDAANRLKAPLRVVGEGPLLGAMRRRAGKTVTVEGRATDKRLRELYQTRRALIFPGEEDFGIVPLEALACGMPVLGLGRGGLRETVPEGVCGAWFERPEATCLAEAWKNLDPAAYDPAELRRQAERFSEARFLEAVRGALDDAVGGCG